MEEEGRDQPSGAFSRVYQSCSESILALFTHPLKQNPFKGNSPVWLLSSKHLMCLTVNYLFLHDFVVLVLVVKNSDKSRCPDKSLTTALLVYLENRPEITSSSETMEFLHRTLLPVSPPSQLY